MPGRAPVFSAGLASDSESGIRVSVASGHHFINLLERTDLPSCPRGSAVQSCRCAGEVEYALQRPVLKQAVDKTGVKNVTSPGGVTCSNPERG